MGSVGMLMGKQEGGAAWLQGLREVPYLEASEALCSLPGVGPKVASPLLSGAVRPLDPMDMIMNLSSRRPQV